MEYHTIQISWQQIHELVEKLGQDIVASGFRPDCLIGISMGGLIPLALCAKQLGIRDTMTISATSYSDIEQGALVVGNVPSADLKDRTVLVIDEIADTGDTLREVVRVLQTQCNANVLKTATLVVRTDKCSTRPDFSALEADRWVDFPWD